MAGVHLDRRLTPAGNGALEILTYLRAGIGFGGSCLPKDVDALRSFGAERGVEMPLLDAVAKVNRERPRRVVALLEGALGGLAGRTIAILGLAFKPGTDDLRASPALAVIPVLVERGATVRAYDPMVRTVAGLDVTADVAAALAGADAALVATAWPAFRELEWAKAAATMRRPVIVDGRGGLEGVPLPEGVTYIRIGQGR